MSTTSTNLDSAATDPAATAPDDAPLRKGDLVEIVRPFPWSSVPEYAVGTQLLVGSDPYPMEHSACCDPEPCGITGDVFDAEDPQGMWFGGDDVPASCVKVVRRAGDLLPDLEALTESVAHALHSMSDGPIDVIETGQEHPGVLYVIAQTPDKVRVSFQVRVGAVGLQEG